MDIAGTEAPLRCPVGDRTVDSGRALHPGSVNDYKWFFSLLQSMGLLPWIPTDEAKRRGRLHRSARPPLLHAEVETLIASGSI